MVRLRIVLCITLGIAALACGEDRERAEARRFLALYEAIGHDGPLPARELQVNDLAALTFETPDVKAAQGACVSAHRSLLAAERAQDDAGRALEAALSAKPDGAPLAVADSAKVQAEITRAERALAAARDQFTPCEQKATSLSARFAAR